MVLQSPVKHSVIQSSAAIDTMPVAVLTGPASHEYHVALIGPQLYRPSTLAFPPAYKTLAGILGVVGVDQAASITQPTAGFALAELMPIGLAPQVSLAATMAVTAGLVLDG